METAIFVLECVAVVVAWGLWFAIGQVVAAITTVARKYGIDIPKMAREQRAAKRAARDETE